MPMQSSGHSAEKQPTSRGADVREDAPPSGDVQGDPPRSSVGPSLDDSRKMLSAAVAQVAEPRQSYEERLNAKMAAYSVNSGTAREDTKLPASSGSGEAPASSASSYEERLNARMAAYDDQAKMPASSGSQGAEITGQRQTMAVSAGAVSSYEEKRNAKMAAYSNSRDSDVARTNQATASSSVGEPQTNVASSYEARLNAKMATYNNSKPGAQGDAGIPDNAAASMEERLNTKMAAYAQPEPSHGRSMEDRLNEKMSAFQQGSEPTTEERLDRKMAAFALPSANAQIDTTVNEPLVQPEQEEIGRDVAASMPASMGSPTAQPGPTSSETGGRDEKHRQPVSDENRPGAHAVPSRAPGGAPAWIRNRRRAPRPTSSRRRPGSGRASLLSRALQSMRVISPPSRDASREDMVEAEVTPITADEPKEDKKWIPIAIVVIILIVVAVVVAVVLTVGGGSDDDGDKEISTEAPSPTMLPASPTASPTYGVRFQSLRGALYNVSGDALFDSTSPQYAALEWLSYEDTASLSEADPGLVQRYIVSVFYFATGGSEWSDQANFLSNQTICDWHTQDGLGVTCLASGAVRSVELVNNNLIGTIPIELTLLRAMSTLVLRLNSLSGPIPPNIGNLSLLRVLDLTGNMLTGSIPSGIGSLTSLEVLKATNGALEGSIPESMANLDRLQELVLENNRLESSIPLFIGSLPLRLLNLGNNVLTGSIPSFENPSLQELQLHGNLLTGTLDNLVLNSTDLPLSRLTLDGNSLGGTIPPEISNFSSLRILFLGVGPVSSNQFVGTIPSEIGMLTDLRQLLLYGNFGLDGTIPTELGLMTDLEQCSLGGNDLFGTLPTEVGRLVELQLFDVQHNSLTGTLPVELANLEDLRQATFAHNLFEGQVPLSLQALTDLRFLYLQENDFSGSLDETFCSGTIVFQEFLSDCLGASPEVLCGCCTLCCSDDQVDECPSL